MVKRKQEKKGDNKESCDMNGHCTCKWFSLKVAVIAFTLFIVTVWPAVGNWLVGVPWWIYLIIFIVFGAVAMVKGCWCCKK
jgi:hypothetical protein